jgi:hypothetical protein
MRALVTAVKSSSFLSREEESIMALHWLWYQRLRLALVVIGLLIPWTGIRVGYRVFLLAYPRPQTCLPRTRSGTGWADSPVAGAMTPREAARPR